MLQNAVSSPSWRPIPLRLVPAPSKRSYGLGQAQPAPPLLVEVIEVGGNPVQGANVEVLGSSTKYVQPQMTDKTGQVKFYVDPGNYTIRATYNGLVVTKKVTSDEIQNGITVFLQFPVCIHGPLIRPIDLLIFATAAGMIVAGSHFKVRPLEMTGEVALGAALFGFIYRLQCI